MTPTDQASATEVDIAFERERCNQIESAIRDNAFEPYEGEFRSLLSKHRALCDEVERLRRTTREAERRAADAGFRAGWKIGLRYTRNAHSDWGDQEAKSYIAAAFPEPSRLTLAGGTIRQGTRDTGIKPEESNGF